MKIRTFIILVTVAALAAVGVTLYQHHRGELAELSAEGTRRKAELAVAELKRLSARELELRRLRAGFRMPDRLGRDPGFTATTAASPDDPAAVRQAVVRAHAAAFLRYRPLFVSLHLAPEQEQKLASTVEDYELRARDIWEEGNAEGLSTSDPALWQLMKPDYDKMRADVTGLVGDAGFQQVDEYNRSLVAHDFSTALVSSLYFTDTPLTAQRAAALEPAVASLSPGYQQGHSAIDLYTKDWSDSYPQLAGILTPAQLSALQSVVAARQSYVKLSPLVGASIGYVANAAAQKPAATSR